VISKSGTIFQPVISKSSTGILPVILKSSTGFQSVILLRWERQVSTWPLVRRITPSAEKNLGAPSGTVIPPVFSREPRATCL